MHAICRMWWSDSFIICEGAFHFNKKHVGQARISPSQRTEILCWPHACWRLPLRDPSNSVTWASSVALPKYQWTDTGTIITKQSNKGRFKKNRSKYIYKTLASAVCVTAFMYCTLMGGVVPGVGCRRIWQPFWLGLCLLLSCSFLAVPPWSFRTDSAFSAVVLFNIYGKYITLVTQAYMI